MTTLDWTCACGKVEARIPQSGVSLVCYCNSCRGFLERLERTEWLDEAGGVSLFQTASERVEITRGHEQLSWSKMSKKGPMRWYARCCQSPMATTLGSPKLSFASFHAHGLEPKGQIGRVRFRAFPDYALKKPVKRRGNVLAWLVPMLFGMVRARLTGQWRNTPFFGSDGKPIATRQDPVAPKS